METVIQGEDELHRFLNAAYYTDKCLGEFIAKAKKTSWWDNTLIVVTADHGHPYPDNQGVSNPKKFKIPMLWLGGALTKKDTVIHSVATQTDIPNTILAQFKLDASSFKFGQNILSTSYNPFSVFVFNNGFGMVRQDRLFVYDNVSNSIIHQEGELRPDDLMEGKAYIQTLYWDYNGR
jgi:phosphoglycerol transferase MdoB-like AlkP superfamily enzyme